MRKAIRTAALVLLLASTCPVYAGEYPFGSPQPPPQTTQEVTPQGNIPNMLLAQLALNLLTLI